MKKPSQQKNETIHLKQFKYKKNIQRKYYSKNKVNVLRWYPFKENSSVLQITNTNDALSRFLYDKAKTLDLYNFSNNSFFRCAKKNIFVPIDSSVRLCKYDYIVTVGFLDFFDLEKDFESKVKDFIKLCSSFVKKHGTILIADDFLKVRSFSQNNNKKSALKSLLNIPECHIKKIYYLHLNVDNCYEIFTDVSLKRMFPSNINASDDNGKIHEYTLDKDYYAVYKYGDPSNIFSSYLIEFNNSSKENIDYVKISSNRFDKFALITSIDMSKGFVYKMPITNKSKDHINKLLINNKNYQNISYIKYIPCNNRIRCDYIKGETLYQKFYAWSFNNNNKQIIKNIMTIKQYLYDCEPKLLKPSNSFKKVFGAAKFDRPLHWKKDQCIDIIASNIILSKNKYYLIDNEWCFNFMIPTEYILWRFIHHSLCKDIFTKKEILEDILNISKNEYDEFLKMELHFSIKYVGNYS